MNQHTRTCNTCSAIVQCSRLTCATPKSNAGESALYAVVPFKPTRSPPCVAMSLLRCLQHGSSRRACCYQLHIGALASHWPVCHRRRCSDVSVRGAKTYEAQLQWVSPENRQEVAQILQQAERAAVRWEITYTNFFSPPVVADALTALAQMSDITAVAWGGYPQAERCRIAMGREDVMLSAKDDPNQLADAVAVLDCRGNFMFDPATHRDFLGAILGTGVVRDKVGDILIQGEGGAQILVDPELVEHFEASLTKVRTVSVETRAVPLSQLRVAPPRKEEINSIEASLRLDAVASAGFRMSRGKMGDYIKGGDVRLNWRPVSKASVEVKEGDVVSCSGKGRLEIVSISRTKKEKYSVSMVRYV